MFHQDRIKQLSRLFLIVNELETGQSVTRASLAELCGCSERTILRDLALLREMEVEYSYDLSAKSYCLTAPIPFATLSFPLPELMALAMACEYSLGQPNLPLACYARRAFARLQARIPQPLRDELQRTKQVVSSGGTARRDYSSSHWMELSEAAKRGQTVQLLYHTKSRNSFDLRKIDPYHLAERDGYYVLLGYCHTRREVRVFSLDSIRSLSLTGKSFERPDDFSPQEYLQNSVGVLRGAMTEIVLRFKPEVAVWAQQRVWPFGYETSQEPDGSILLRGTVSGLEGIKSQLLSWGAKVVVIEPKELRQLLCEEAQKMLAEYDDEAADKRLRKKCRKKLGE